jgi:hypothetical protein
LVDFCEETGDLTPTGALAGFAGIAYQHDVEVQTVAGGIDHAMGSAAQEVAVDGQKLEEHGGRVGLGVGRDGADGAPCEAVERGFAQAWICGWGGRGGARGFRCRRRVWGRWWISIGFRLLAVVLGLSWLREAE